MANIISVNYTKTYNLGNYSSEKIGIELSLNENEDPKEALECAKNLADEFHIENNKGLYCQDMSTGKVTMGESMPSIQQPVIKNEETKPLTLIEQINTCTAVKVLETYKLMVRNNPEEQKAYDNMLNKLINGRDSK